MLLLPRHHLGVESRRGEVADVRRHDAPCGGGLAPDDLTRVVGGVVVDEDGVVGSPVTVTSEKGADCQFISPWASARDGNVVVKDAAGNTVQVNAGSPTGGDAHPDQYWFKTDAGMTYYLSQA